ncbi:hypothetical protein IW261DRAFT_1608120 [Armillaria novae-zelandiae]|uniref:Uncharacterized protein n=1 Tax=Armillaria novae-zelandiae TaxID=153914 RepID=A0AA39P7V2_9AGAR|nr:hypothetical protein IW261DRAFT_1608120 [Armillaria novae-zelandiae]
MSCWSQHAEDYSRIPEGFRRIGNDADKMPYTFTDRHEKLYRSAPSEEYNTLTQVTGSVSMDKPSETFSEGENLTVESARPAPKLRFSDFLPQSVMTSASSSLDQYTPTSPFTEASVNPLIPRVARDL